jgi:mycofactocin glycosyltransferase
LDSCLAAAGGPALVVDDGSADAAAVAAVCERRGARLIRRDVSGGPAVARNVGLALVETPLVAFVDSDCRPPVDWVERLAGHFVDPRVAAVAPRIRAVSEGRGPVARFAVARSPIDMGDRPARVVPTQRISYVPTAALLVRRAALGAGFDEALRYGEDVDLVWRLHAEGWTVRFDPSVEVRHQEPSRARDLLVRHYRYGTGAADLEERHPGRLGPLKLEPWTTALALAALSGRPRLSAGIAAVQVARAVRAARRAGLDPKLFVTWPLRGAGQTIVGTGHVLTMFAAPALLAALAPRRTRKAALVLLLAPPLTDYARRRPRLDPVRWTLLTIADDAAYGTGVWVGCARRRTLGPLTPTWTRPR